MNEIVTLPASLQSQIQNAQNLLAKSERDQQQGDYQGALVNAREGIQALVEVAQRSPELAVAVMGLAMGYKGIKLVHRTTSTRHERVEKKGLFGFTSTSYMVPVTDTSVDEKTIYFLEKYP